MSDDLIARLLTEADWWDEATDADLLARRHVDPEDAQVPVEPSYVMREAAEVLTAARGVLEQERERCARIAETYRAAPIDPRFNPLATYFNTEGHPVANTTARDIAALIRRPLFTHEEAPDGR